MKEYTKKPVVIIISISILIFIISITYINFVNKNKNTDSNTNVYYTEYTNTDKEFLKAKERLYEQELKKQEIRHKKQELPNIIPSKINNIEQNKVTEFSYGSKNSNIKPNEQTETTTYNKDSVTHNNYTDVNENNNVTVTTNELTEISDKLRLEELRASYTQDISKSIDSFLETTVYPDRIKENEDILNSVGNLNSENNNNYEIDVKNLMNEEQDDLKKKIYYLAKIIHCEESSQKEEDLYKKVAVGIVVMNRVKHPKFPNTVEEVIFADRQFSPTFDGAWEKKEPTEFDYRAATLAIMGVEVKGIDGKSINDALFFMNPVSADPNNSSWFYRELKYLDKVGGHEFFTYK